MAVCFGKYPRNVDQKGRIVVPPNFREIVGEEIYIAKWKDKRISIFPAKVWEEQFNQYNNKDIFDNEADRRKTWLASIVRPSKFDKAGRMIIPSDYMEHAGIDIEVEVAIVGDGEKIDIWKPETYDQYLNSFMEKPEGW